MHPEHYMQSPVMLHATDLSLVQLGMHIHSCFENGQIESSVTHEATLILSNKDLAFAAAH